MILDADISPDHFERVTAYMTSSAPVAPELAAEFERRYGIPVVLGYGATAFLNSVTVWTAELYERFGPTKHAGECPSNASERADRSLAATGRLRGFRRRPTTAARSVNAEVVGLLIGDVSAS